MTKEEILKKIHISLDKLTKDKPLLVHSILNAMEEYAQQQNDINFKWVPFDFDKYETCPPEDGKYLVVRKDGKKHWETWNGSGWAYNGKVIKYWARIPDVKI